MKYIKNGNTYDVGLDADYIDFPWASICMTLKGYRSMPQNLILNILKTVTDTRLTPEDFFKSSHGLSIGPSDLTFADLEGSKIKVILFDV